MKRLGVYYTPGQGCTFAVWAPLLKQMILHLELPIHRDIPLQRDDDGVFHVTLKDIAPGTKYFYNLQGLLSPDPASHHQPQDVFGPSEVIDHASFSWQDATWKGVELRDMIIYELHVGTFTPEGTFEAAEKRLNDLLDLGITTIEIMPVAQFPGNRNWGYDGVFPFAVQHSYGGPLGLKNFVNTCHQKGLSVLLDVVYNHLGPEGNVINRFMPVFTEKYHTPWGGAINFDEAYSHGVREYFIQNTLYWMENYHIDGLRLDAIHSIFDTEAIPFLRQLANRVDEFSKQKGRQFYLIAESDLNDRRVVLPTASEGFGIDSQWSDDFHHALHTLLTHENVGYYQDFGSVQQLAKAIKDGFVYDGIYSTFRKHSHGINSNDLPSESFVVCIQNHDQVGNRFKGERLSSLVSFEALKLAAGTVLFSPYVPLLFMGEEYGEDAPFNYFMSFIDEKLIEAVRQGRKREFAAFGWKVDPPDPYAQKTFLQSKLNWDKRQEGHSKTLLSFYKKLIELRKSTLALVPDRRGLDISIQNKLLMVQCPGKTRSLYMLMNFDSQAVTIKSHFPTVDKLLDSAENHWQGPGSLLTDQINSAQEITVKPWQFALYQAL